MMTPARRYEIVFIRPDSRLLTLDGLAERAGVHPGVLQRYVDCGLMEPNTQAGGKLFFSVNAVSRLRMIQRLREQLGINLAGIAVILDMRDRIDAMQREIERQRARL